MYYIYLLLILQRTDTNESHKKSPVNSAGLNLWQSHKEGERIFYLSAILIVIPQLTGSFGRAAFQSLNECEPSDT